MQAAAPCTGPTIEDEANVSRELSQCGGDAAGPGSLLSPCVKAPGGPLSAPCKIRGHLHEVALPPTRQGAILSAQETQHKHHHFRSRYTRRLGKTDTGPDDRLRIRDSTRPRTPPTPRNRAMRSRLLRSDSIRQDAVVPKEADNDTAVFRLERVHRWRFVQEVNPIHIRP